MEKIPSDDYEEGNSCHICGSSRITLHEQVPIFRDSNYNSGTILKFEDDGSSHTMTPKEKVEAYDKAECDGVGCWQFECRKCGWKSKIFRE